MTFQIASAADLTVQPEAVQLPSQQGTDQAVLLKRPDLITLLGGAGNIPDVLTGLIMDSMEGGGAKTELKVTRENMPGILQSLNAICKATFVQPLVWEAESDDTHVNLGDLSFQDKSFVFAWALGADYESTKSFRDEPPGDVEPVPSHNGVSGAAQRKAATRS